jgi:hypothetical protein
LPKRRARSTPGDTLPSTPPFSGRPKILRLCEKYVMQGGSDDELYAAYRAVADCYRELPPTGRWLVRLHMRGGTPGTQLGERRADLRDLFSQIDRE